MCQEWRRWGNFNILFNIQRNAKQNWFDIYLFRINGVVIVSAEVKLLLRQSFPNAVGLSDLTGKICAGLGEN